MRILSVFRACIIPLILGTTLLFMLRAFYGKSTPYFDNVSIRLGPSSWLRVSSESNYFWAALLSRPTVPITMSHSEYRALQEQAYQSRREVDLRVVYTASGDGFFHKWSRLPGYQGPMATNDAGEPVPISDSLKGFRHYRALGVNHLVVLLICTPWVFTRYRRIKAWRKQASGPKTDHGA